MSDFLTSSSSPSSFQIDDSDSAVNWQSIAESDLLKPLRQAGLRRMASLTNRENQILVEVTSGLPNKAIASKLGISFKTVEKHRASVMRKLRVKTVPDLMRLWIQAHPEDLRLQGV